MAGPTPDLDTITALWQATMLDGSAPQGVIELVYEGGPMRDPSSSAPVTVFPVPMSKPITTRTVSIDDKSGTPRQVVIGEASFQIPASNDPDIDGAGGTYRVTEKLSNGSGRTYSFFADINTPGGVIKLAEVAPTGSNAGTPLSVVTVSQLTALTGRVTALETETDSGVLTVAGVSPDGTGNVPLTATNIPATGGTVQNRLNAKADLVGGLVPSSQLPSLVINNTFVVASQAAMLATGANKGDIAKRTDVAKSFILSATPATTLANWIEISTSGAVDSVNGQTGPVTLQADDIPYGGSNVQAGLDAAASAVAGKLAVSGTMAAGLVPKVQLDGTTVAWDTDLLGSGGGGAVSLGDRVLFVYASGESGATGPYVCDGTSDQVQINAALAALSNSGTNGDTIGRGTVGGTVILVGRRFSIDGPILMRTQTRLTGAYGEFGTQIRAVSPYAPGNTGGMIQLLTTDVQYVTVDHLTLDGQGRQTCGLYINVGTGQEYDSYLKFHDLYIWNCGGTSGVGDGISMQNNSGGRLRGNHLSSIRVINAGRYGCYVNGPDSFYERIDCGSSGSHGFNITHANNRFVNCKSWFSDGAGFLTSTASRDNQFSACEAQDNLQHGFHIQGARNSFSSCCADSNSYDASPNTAVTGRNFHGFYVAGNYTNVHGTASDKNEGGRLARQVYGVHVASGVTAICNVTTTGNFTGSLQNLGTMSGFVVGT